MNFASVRFLVFMAVVFAAHWSLRGRWRLVLLLVAGYGFYALFDWRFLAVLAGLTLLNHVCGARIHAAGTPRARRAWLLASLLGSLGVLALLKYLPFAVESFARAAAALGFRVPAVALSVLVPVGVSYYTFQLLSYTLDIYRGQIRPTASLLTFAAFPAFFAHIVAGPITRARELIPQLERERTLGWEDLEAGLTRFLFGYFKKVFIADTLATYLVDPVFGAPGTFAPGVLWLAWLGYFVQVYADFSGYSSMAIGSARLLGLRLPENFAFPYLSTNIAEFWRRWHISLSRWLRDYLWWPLSSRIPFAGGAWARVRWAGALVTVFLVCGIWHGPRWTFVVWGLAHGGYLVAYDTWHRARVERGAALGAFGAAGALGAWALTQAAVGFSWLIFRADTLADLRLFLHHLVASPGAGTLALPLSVWVAFAAFAVDHLAAYVREAHPGLPGRIPAPVKGLAYAAMALFLFATRPMHADQFIYFQF